MPYEDTQTQLGDQQYILYNKNPNGQQVLSTLVTGLMRQTKLLKRTGGNASSIRNYTSAKPPKVYERRLVTVYQGPKTKTRYFDTKYKRFRYAREPIKAWRLVRVLPKSSKKRKGMDLPPNPLQFRSCEVFGDMGTQTINGPYPGAPGWERVYVGDLMYLPMIGPGATNSIFDPVMYSNYPISVADNRWLEAETSAETRALSKLHEKAKNQSVNLAQFLAERKQTVALFAETATRLAKALILLKKGKVSTAAKELFPTNAKDIANDVLAFNFGVKPLLSDLDGMAKHLAEGPEKIEFDIIARSREEIPISEQTEYVSRPIPCSSTLVTFGYVEVTYKLRVRVAMPKYREFDRLGFGNPLSLAWELIPWSFVIDWALPIGDYLNKLDSFDGLTIIHGHKTVFRKKSTRIVRNYGGSYQGYDFESKTVSRRFEQVECNRVLLTKFPEVRLPSLRDPTSLTRIINMTALLTQLRKSS